MDADFAGSLAVVLLALVFVGNVPSRASSSKSSLDDLEGRCVTKCAMFRADTRRSESFHTFLIMGEFSDLIGLQSEIWPLQRC
jgi:hypothetical protein